MILIPEALPFPVPIPKFKRSSKFLGTCVRLDPYNFLSWFKQLHNFLQSSFPICTTKKLFYTTDKENRNANPGTVLSFRAPFYLSHPAGAV